MNFHLRIWNGWQHRKFLYPIKKKINRNLMKCSKTLTKVNVITVRDQLFFKTLFKSFVYILPL